MGVRRRDEGVRRVQDDIAVALRDCNAFQDDGPAVLDADDGAAAREHGCDRPGAVGDDDFERGYAMARSDDDPMNLTADANGMSGNQLGDLCQSEPAEAVNQSSSLELVYRRLQPLSE